VVYLGFSSPHRLHFGKSEVLRVAHVGQIQPVFCWVVWVSGMLLWISVSFFCHEYGSLTENCNRPVASLPYDPALVMMMRRFLRVPSTKTSMMPSSCISIEVYLSFPSPRGLWSKISLWLVSVRYPWVL
jgi:hypothetical protein